MVRFSVCSTLLYYAIYCILIYLFNLTSIVCMRYSQCIQRTFCGCVRIGVCKEAARQKKRARREKKTSQQQHYTNNKTQHFLTLFFCHGRSIFIDRIPIKGRHTHTQGRRKTRTKSLPISKQQSNKATTTKQNTLTKQKIVRANRKKITHTKNCYRNSKR